MPCRGPCGPQGPRGIASADPFLRQFDDTVRALFGVPAIAVRGPSVCPRPNTGAPRSGACTRPCTAASYPTEGSIRCDVLERPDAYIIVAEVPGFSDQDLEVEVHEQVVSISGRQSHAREFRGVKRLIHERETPSSFSRRFPLPEDAVVDAMTASLERAILTIEVPRSIPPPPRSIPVRLVTDEQAPTSKAGPSGIKPIPPTSLATESVAVSEEPSAPVSALPPTDAATPAEHDDAAAQSADVPAVSDDFVDVASADDAKPGQQDGKASVAAE